MSETKRTSPVRARTKVRGQVSRRLETLADSYRASHPGREVRFVFDPTTKVELSKVIQRAGEGYEPVRNAEIPELASLPGDQLVRVGDTILMSIPSDLKMESEADRAEIAAEERMRVRREFYASQEGVAVDNPKTGERHRARPIGTVEVNVRDFEYDLEQRTANQEEG